MDDSTQPIKNQWDADGITFLCTDAGEAGHPTTTDVALRAAVEEVGLVTGAHVVRSKHTTVGKAAGTGKSAGATVRITICDAGTRATQLIAGTCDGTGTTVVRVRHSVDTGTGTADQRARTGITAGATIRSVRIRRIIDFHRRTGATTTRLIRGADVATGAAIRIVRTARFADRRTT